MKRNTEKALAGVVVATGISAVVSQLLIIREYLACFQGNEYVIALIFFTWLLLGGLGSYAGGLFLTRFFKPGAGTLTALTLLAAVLPVSGLLTIRLARDLVFAPGVSTGFYGTFAFIAATLGPYGFLIGFLLPCTIAVWRSLAPGFPGAKLYLLDNSGNVIGGVLFSFVLITLLSPLQTTFVCSLVLVLTAARLAHFAGCLSIKTGVAIFASIGVLVGGVYFEKPSLAPDSGRLADYRETRHGRLTVISDQGQMTLFVDGEPLSGNRDVAAAEAAVHYPLAQTNGPGRVLIVSAGGGMLKEIAKYEPTAIDYVEMNPEIANVQLRFGLIDAVPGLNVIRQDGRAFLMETSRRYTAIIINTPQPATFQANRYYTAEFYRLVKKRLAPQGVMGFSIAGYANYLSEPKRRVIASLYQTARLQFTNVMVLPGKRVFFICSDGPVHRDIPGRLQQKGIHTDYVDGYFYGQVTGPRVDALHSRLQGGGGVNRDTRPYLMQLMFKRWFEKFATTPKWLYIALAALLCLYFIGISREAYLLFSTGFVTMGCELAVIFAFQIFFGYVYSQISLIVTVFLGGLLPGALLGRRFAGQAAKTLLVTDSLLAGLCLFSALLVLWGGVRPGAWVLLLFSFCVALLCGCQFPLALASGGQSQRITASAFSADLFGAAYGALLVSVLLIPGLGLGGALLALTGLKLSSLLLTARMQGK